MEIELGRRRVHRTGGSCAISLPRVWCRTFGVEGGMEVALRMVEGGRLVIELAPVEEEVVDAP